ATAAVAGAPREPLDAFRFLPVTAMIGMRLPLRPGAGIDSDEGGLIALFVQDDREEEPPGQVVDGRRDGAAIGPDPASRRSQAILGVRGRIGEPGDVGAR